MNAAEPNLEKTTETNVVNILWTGGWDSTFRVVDCALMDKALIQPYYIRDPPRASTEKELETISKIRGIINARAGEERVRSPKIFTVTDVRPNPEITEAYNRLKKVDRLGSQYDWLARFAHEYGVKGLELGIYSDRMARFINKEMGRPKDVDLVFGSFRFPLLYLTKIMMREQAVEKGFLDILELSWFCHRGGAAPCGTCSPCRDAIAEGMGYRLPARAHVRNRIFRILLPVRSVAKRILRRR